MNGNAATQVSRTVNVVDTTAPVITLNGDASVTLEVGSTYTELGATFSDNYDQNGDATVGGDTVDTTTVGTYTITYDVTDVNGNAATQVTRVVIISSPGRLKDIYNENNYIPMFQKVTLNDDYDLFVFFYESTIRVVIYDDSNILYDGNYKKSYTSVVDGVDDTLSDLHVTDISLIFSLRLSDGSYVNKVWRYEDQAFMSSNYCQGTFISNDFTETSVEFYWRLDIFIYNVRPIFVETSCTDGVYTMNNDGSLESILFVDEKYTDIRSIKTEKTNPKVAFDFYLNFNENRTIVFNFETQTIAFSSEKTSGSNVYTKAAIYPYFTYYSVNGGGSNYIVLLDGSSYDVDSMNVNRNESEEKYLICEDASSGYTCNYRNEDHSLIYTFDVITRLNFLEFLPNDMLQFSYLSATEHFIYLVDADGTMSLPPKFDQIKNTAEEFKILGTINFSYNWIYITRFKLSTSDDYQYLYTSYSNNKGQYHEFVSDVLIQYETDFYKEAFQFELTDFLGIIRQNDDGVTTTWSVLSYNFEDDIVASVTIQFNALLDYYLWNNELAEDRAFIYGSELFAFFRVSDTGNMTLLRLDMATLEYDIVENIDFSFSLQHVSYVNQVLKFTTTSDFQVVFGQETLLVEEIRALDTDDFYIYYDETTIILANKVITLYYETIDDYIEDTYTEKVDIYVDGELIRTLTGERIYYLYLYEYNNMVYLYNAYDNMLYGLSISSSRPAYLDNDGLMILNTLYLEESFESAPSNEWIDIFTLFDY